MVIPPVGGPSMPLNQVRWQTDVDDWVSQTPELTEDRVYVPDFAGGLSAIDRETGKLDWHRQFEADTEWQAVDDGPVVGQRDQTVIGLDPETGDQLWSTAIGRARLVVDDAALTYGEGQLRRLDGPGWQAALDSILSSAPLTHHGGVSTVERTAPDLQTLTHRDLVTGKTLWQTSDGKIQHLTPKDSGLYYSSWKIMPDRRERTHVQLRDASGEVSWQTEMTGKVRAMYVAPDEATVVVEEMDIFNRARSHLTALNGQTGEKLWSVGSEPRTELVFANDGSILVADTSLNRWGEATSTFRRLDPTSGETLWQKNGRPDWFWAGDSALALWLDEENPRLEHLDDEGEVRWSRTVDPGTTRVSVTDGKVHLMNGKVKLQSLDLDQGQAVGEFESGHYLYWEKLESSMVVADHQGSVTGLDLGQPVGQSSPTLDQDLPLNVRFKAAPAEREGVPVAYIDWNDTGSYDGYDPLLTDVQGKPLSWPSLETLDVDGNRALDSQELAEVYRQAEGEELQPLIDGELFDKGRLLLDGEELRVASGSR